MASYTCTIYTNGPCPPYQDSDQTRWALIILTPETDRHCFQHLTQVSRTSTRLLCLTRLKVHHHPALHQQDPKAQCPCPINKHALLPPTPLAINKKGWKEHYQGNLISHALATFLHVYLTLTALTHKLPGFLSTYLTIHAHGIVGGVFQRPMGLNQEWKPPLSTSPPQHGAYEWMGTRISRCLQLVKVKKKVQAIFLRAFPDMVYQGLVLTRIQARQVSLIPYRQLGGHLPCGINTPPNLPSEREINPFPRITSPMAWCQ